MNCIKSGVRYNLVDIPDCIRPWLVATFATWEPETFTVFEWMTSKQEVSVVLDIGAYIGLTAVWLCANFDHVVCVDADRESVKSLKNNLDASGCTNYTVVEKAVYSASDKKLAFGPNKFIQNSQLNDSTSQLKEKKSQQYDYEITTVSIADLVSEFPSTGFIKCDIEGGEEHILENLFEQKIPMYISFHISWWTDKNISRFSHLFSTAKRIYRNGLITELDPVAWLTANPFGSLLITF